MKIKYQLLTPTAVPPQKMTEHSAGWDLSADLPEPVLLNPLSRLAIPTGLALELPQGYEAQVRPRSGLALNLGLGVLNGPGTIDSDYRGEVKVILFNISEEAVLIQPGMRIAQLVVAPVTACGFEETESLADTERSGGGFGSTGH
jgi:dUTP pyrophosphatase